MKNKKGKNKSSEQDHDEDNMVLEKNSLNECHPIEDPNALPIFDSDEENEIDYEDIVNTCKVAGNSDDLCTSEEDSDEDVIIGGSDDKYVGLEVVDKDVGSEVIHDKDAGPETKPEWYKKFQDDFGIHGDEEEVPLFPEEELVIPVDPAKMEVKYAFNNKSAFQKHLRGYCVIHNCQYKTKKK
ncbi:hypothetical protein MKX01_008403 [Papaver californicum]|nr:hypothetical protein MKX01_008403 [Papaver californicum]